MPPRPQPLLAIAVALACAQAQPQDPTAWGSAGVEASHGAATSDGDSSDDDGTTATTTAAAHDSGDGSDGSSSDTGPSPPFSCTKAAASSPILDAEVIFDPAAPHPGDTLSVIVRARNGLSNADAPAMSLSVEHAGGTLLLEPTMRAGGDALYYYAIPELAPGDVCVLGLVDGAPEVAAAIAVSPRPPGPPVGAGAFKVIENHQWRCDEQPDFGNELHLWVRDSNGVGIPGATLRVAPADSTDLATVYNGSDGIPSTLVTDDAGYVKDFDFWPISAHGLLVLEIAVDGAASDIATEITTGWWESDESGCRYCDAASPINVWGHWSHSIVFQRDPGATTLCRVPVDHAGQAACGPPGHVLHDPDHVACWAIE
ncbi:MAG: hypothetical protein K1X88_01745 [Nannocystaceae bacterium]|nr:hypothetical protein [Nannocystaceae bacterium]